MPYDKEEIEKFRLSGKILRETREEMRSYVTRKHAHHRCLRES